MKHYSTTEWIDFVNFTVSQTLRQEMQKHLDSGCQECLEAAALWEKVQESAKSESSFQPPAGSVRAVKAAFAALSVPTRKKVSEVLAEIVFDTLQRPALAGVRSSVPQARQMLFRAHPFEIDVQVEALPGDYRLRITGQILDTSRSGAAASALPVTLSNRRGQIVRTVTNRFGEFNGNLENCCDLELSFLSENKTVVVPLASALSHLVGTDAPWNWVADKSATKNSLGTSVPGSLARRTSEKG